VAGWWVSLSQLLRGPSQSISRPQVLYDSSNSFQGFPIMIGRLSGILVEKNPPQLLVDCQGVGYEVNVPMSTFYNLPGLGDKVALLTHLAIREDAHVLFGFGTADERNVFKQLIKISGVGARTALSILSGMSVADLSQAITLQEAGRLTKVPGIGKKTAERLLLELKGKLGAEIGAAGGVAVDDASSDILNALLALGYSDKEALLSLKQIPAGTGVSDGIKLALKALSKG
jgi:Holliday junction DNA helicase RuvA